MCPKGIDKWVNAQVIVARMVMNGGDDAAIES
jgi:hypothetical protein